MAASSATVRLVLRKLANDAATASATLGATLKAVAFGSVSAVVSGKDVIEVQAEGVVTKFQIPTGGSALQASDVTEMLSRLLDLYDAVVATVGEEDDEEILAAMLARIVPIREVASNFRGLRV